MDKPTEDTYTTEFIAVIKEYLGNLGFDAEFNWNTPSGKPDMLIYYKGNLIAIIEVKIPSIRLSDPKLNKQAIKYAKWYKENRNVNFYGIHNLRYLKLLKYVSRQEAQTTLDEFISSEKYDWIPISEFPFKIMPWVNSIEEFKQISQNKKSRENVTNFFLNLREILVGKTLDLSKDVIETIREFIKRGANLGLSQMENFYRSDKNNVKEIFEGWRQKRGISLPKNDNSLREYLTLMMREQIYTFSLKVLFYYVLQSINKDMAEKLNENLNTIELSNAEVFKNIFEILFKFAIERSGDFEEVFGSNTVERLPFTSNMLPVIKLLISYISQIRWKTISIDIIGRIFESLIHSERRHLLGQHYTDTTIVDLILVATLKRPGKILDPSCGSGTFIVRALNYWKTKKHDILNIFNLIEGVDIDKLAVMLTKINLYIQTLEKIKNISDYIPKVYNNDIFKLNLSQNYSYVITNPPYTRQEEMTMAYYNKDYKKYLMETVKDISNWSKRASIYAYFLIKAGKLLQEGGRLGFIVENSWVNTEYGLEIKKWFLENFDIELVLESNVERWFEDAKVITNIIIAEKKKITNNNTQFVYFLKPLSKIINPTPSTDDWTANIRYYESIEKLINKIKGNILPENERYSIIENPNVRIVSVRKDFLIEIEENFGKWGLFKGPKKYLELLFKFLDKKIEGVKFMDDVINIKRGLTTNANEIFYLPSKYWEYSLEDGKFLILKDERKKIIKISKQFLKPLIRIPDLKGKDYGISDLKRIRKEDYVLWIDQISSVDDQGTKDYIEWAEKFIVEANKTDRVFPSILKKIKNENTYSKWTGLPDRSKATFLIKNAIHKNYCIYYNNILEGQVDKRLFLGTSKIKSQNKIVFAILNSVVTYLGMELIGRTNLGEGALDVNVIDYKKIPVIDPDWFETKLKEENKFGEFLEIIDTILKTKPNNIELESKNEIRLRMDEMILKPLGFKKKDVQNLYNDLINLVKVRETRAKSVKKKKEK